MGFQHTDRLKEFQNKQPIFICSYSLRTCTCTFVHCRIMCRWIISFFSLDFFLLTCDSGKHNLNYNFILLFTPFHFFIVGLAHNKYNISNMLQVNFNFRIISVNLDIKKYTKQHGSL